MLAMDPTGGRKLDGTLKQIRVAALNGVGLQAALKRVLSKPCELLMHAEYASIDLFLYDKGL